MFMFYIEFRAIQFSKVDVAVEQINRMFDFFASL
jgi:hypothetical protein